MRGVLGGSVLKPRAI